MPILFAGGRVVIFSIEHQGETENKFDDMSNAISYWRTFNSIYVNEDKVCDLKI